MTERSTDGLWGEVPLGQVATVEMGQSPPSETCSRSGLGSPLLNGPTEFGSTHPVPVQWTTAPARFAQPGDTLFCVRGSTTGRMNVANQKYAIGRGIAAVRGATPGDTAFLRFALMEGLDELLMKTTGTVFPNISGPDLRQFEIPWPPDDVRRDAVAVLEAIEDRIVAMDELVDALGKAISAACHVAFETRATDAEMSLVEAVRLVNGGAYTKGADGKGRMVVRIRELNSGPSETTVHNDITVPDNKTVRPGDVLFAWSGTLGVWRWYGDEAIVNQHIFKVLPKAHPLWLGQVHILDALGEFQDIAAGKATTMGHVTKDHLQRAMVPVLSDGELSALTTVVEPLWDYQLSAGLEVQWLTDLRDFLVPRLLSGELRVAPVGASVAAMVGASA